jgi:hypothetical protein
MPSLNPINKKTKEPNETPSFFHSQIQRDKTEQSMLQYTWYPIGVGGAGCRIVDCFFVSLDSHSTNIKAMTKPLGKIVGLTLPKTISEHILLRGVPGKFGWWLYNISREDIETLTIVSKKFNAYYLHETQSSGLKTVTNFFQRKKKFKSVQDIERLTFLEKYFVMAEEGAGKSWLLGNKNALTLMKDEDGEPKIKKILNVHEGGKWKNTNAVLIVHALGRGTGSGASCVVIDAIKQLKPVTVVALSVFPDFEKEDTNYRMGVAHAFFGLISILQTDKGQRLADSIIFVHNAKLDSLVKRYTTNFIYTEKPSPFNFRFIHEFKKNQTISLNADNGLIVDLMGLLCCNNLLTKDPEPFDVNNLIELNNLPNRIHPNIPALLIPAVYISPNKEATPSELIRQTLRNNEDWLYAHCDPSTAKAIYPILFFDYTKINPRRKYINDEVEKAIVETCPKFEGKRIIEPDHYNTAGAFSACLLFLVDPKLPVLDTYYKITNEEFKETERSAQYYTSDQGSCSLVDMKNLWFNSYQKRAQLLLKIVNQREDD